MADNRTPVKFRSALVTGATGFLGGWLVRRLSDAGVSVTAIVRSTSDPIRLANLPNATKIHTVSNESASLYCGVASAKPDVIFHLAARFASMHNANDIAGLITDNVTLTAQLCEAAIAAKCSSLVAAGTGWQNAGSPANDPTPAPNTLYAASKQAADDIIDYYSAMAGLNAVTLKIYDSYGPEDPRRKFLAILREAAIKNEVIDASPGNQRLYMVHVDDLVDGFIHAGNLLTIGELRGRTSHTLPSPTAMTLREIAEIWMRVNRQQVNINWGSKPHRPGEVMVPWDGVPLPGWSPHTSLNTGLHGC